jgi:hypothetical protein
MSAGNSCAAYMREYKKRKRLEEDNFNNVPKRTNLHAKQHCEYRETHKNLYEEYLRNYGKREAKENETPQAYTSAYPAPSPIIYNYNQANE